MKRNGEGAYFPSRTHAFKRLQNAPKLNYLVSLVKRGALVLGRILCLKFLQRFCQVDKSRPMAAAQYWSLEVMHSKQHRAWCLHVQLEQGGEQGRIGSLESLECNLAQYSHPNDDIWTSSNPIWSAAASHQPNNIMNWFKKSYFMILTIKKNQCVLEQRASL